MVTGYTIDSTANINEQYTLTATPFIEIVGGDNISISDIVSTTSTDYSFGFDTSSPITIESFEYKTTDDGNFIEVVKRQAPNPNVTLAVWPPRPQVDSVWKEIYGVVDGKLELIRTIQGTVTPGHYVDEQIDFEE